MPVLTFLSDYGLADSYVAEVKGAIREIEVYPKGTVEWWFVPVKTGKLTDLICTIPGHAEAGMKGAIEIK